MDQINVEHVMREIDAAAEQAGAEPAFPHLALQQLVPVLREHHQVEPRPPLIGRTRYERLWVRINQIVRRVAAHAVEPAVMQQNEFNTALLDSLQLCMRVDAELRASVVVLRAEAGNTTATVNTVGHSE